MFNRDKADRELDRELHAYVELLVGEKVKAGLSPERARREALLEVGGVEQVKEQVRDVRFGATLETFLQDLRYAGRTLRGSPAFTVAAVLTLAIGIGANTAIFSAVDGVLLKPLPFSHSERIVSLFQNDRKKGIDRDDVAPGNFADWRARTRAFAGMAAAEPFGLVYSGPDGEEQIGNWNVTEDFFPVLDARPVLGRVFHKEDFERGRTRVLVLTYDSWQRRFGGDPGIVGKTLIMRQEPSIVIGVLPRNFSYLGELKRYEMFTRTVLDSAAVNLRSSAWYHVVARLKPGVTEAQAMTDINRVAAQLEQEYPKTNSGIYVSLVQLRDGMVGNAARGLLLLLGAVGFVLLIACTNVANLMLARTARRSREFAIRVALGAGPRRIARQVLTESFLVALAGGIAGVALAYWGVGSIRALSPTSLPRVDEMRVDWRALLFAMGAVVSTSFVFGLLPALRAADPDAQLELKGGSRTTGSGPQHRLRGLLVSTQVALAVVLLVGAGLLTRSFLLVTTLDRGYQSHHVLTGTIFIWQWNRTQAARREFVARLMDRVAAIPGVAASGATTSVPLAGAIGADQGKFTIVGRPVVPGEEPSAHITALTPGTFGALRMNLRRGRVFEWRDDTAAVQVAIVNEAMARRHWPGEDPIGQRIQLGFYGAPMEREVVGVVADTRQSALDAPPEPTVYLPHAQAPSGAVTIVLRTIPEPRLLARELKRAVAEINPQIPVTGITTLDEVVADSLKARRFTMLLFGCFAVAALLLAVIGVYGVISHATAERSREFGVRIALGAQPADIIRMVVGQGLVSAAAGLAVGVLGAAALTSLLRGMLFGVTPFDAVTFVAVGALMFTTAAIASYIPARRATAVQPVTALRVS